MAMSHTADSDSGHPNACAGMWGTIGKSLTILGLVSWLVPALADGETFQTPALSAEVLAALRGTEQDLLVIDVRALGEYKSGHIAGAVNIPHTELEKRLEELSGAENGIVLYCTMGKRTRQAEQTLLDHAIPNVYHLAGGLGAWRQGGYPINTGWGP